MLVIPQVYPSYPVLNLQYLKRKKKIQDLGDVSN